MSNSPSLRLKTLSFVLILFLNIPLLFSQTTSGVLTQDEVWSGLVRVTGDVTVPEDITLTILPGTEVRFAAKSDDRAGGSYKTKSELIIKGSLIAKGSSAEKITFTSAAPVKARGDWGGLNVQYSHGLSSFALEHSLIEYGETGFSWTIQSGLHTASISNSEVRFSNANGIYLLAQNGSSPEFTLSSNRVHDNNGYGIYLYSSGYGTVIKGTVSGNEIYGNGNMGLYCLANSGRTLLSILNNTVSDNGSHGIHTNSSNGTTGRSEYRIEGNTIFNNRSIGLYTYSSATDCDGSISGNRVYGNSHGIYLNSLNGYTHSSSLRGNIVKDNRNSGIYININRNASYIPLTVTANEIFGNQEHGLNIYGANLSLNISLNNIYNNAGNGLYCRGSALVNLVYNSINNNNGDGLYLEGGAGSRVNYNNILDNRGSYALKNGTLNAINGRYNFWSRSILDEITLGDGAGNITAIYDIYDDGTKGVVDCSSPLTGSLSLPLSMASHITGPADGAVVKAANLNIKGIAAAKAGVSRVELSLDNGATWQTATGKESWNYLWTMPAEGAYTLLTRVTDLNKMTLTSTQKLNLTIDNRVPTTSGLLTANEIWSGELLVSGDVTIPSGVVLTIRAGTVVKFKALGDELMAGVDSSRCEMIVKGSLIVEGSAASKARFISSSTVPAGGDWYGLRVLTEESNEQLSLSHLELEDSLQGVDIQAKGFGLNALFESSNISNSSSHGIYFKSDIGSLSSLKVYNSILSSNGQSGIYLDNWSRARFNIELTGNKISRNSSYGLYLYSKDSGSSLEGSVDNNELSANGNSGLYTYSSNSGKSRLSILNNRVGENQSHGIHSNCSGSTTSRSEYTIGGNTVYNNKSSGIYNSTNRSETVLKLLDNTVYGNSYGIQVSSNNYYGQTALIRGNTLRDNSKNGLYIYRSYYSVINPNIIDNNIFGNGEHGVNIGRDSYNNSQWKARPSITLNRIYQNGGMGIYCRSDGGAGLFYNDIRDNTGDGLYLEVDELSIANYNNILDNRGSYALKNGTAGAIDGRFNFWSRSILDEIEAGANPKNLSAIYDSYDEAAKGIVTYSSHLSAAQPLPASMESLITSHSDGLKLKASTLNIRGIAVARAGVSKVELSPDNGSTWHPVSGKESWNYSWTVPGDGLYSLRTRVTDLNNQTAISDKMVNLTIDSSLPTTSGVLTSDEVWSGRVVLTGDLTVPSGLKLTIKAGTVVSFAPLSDDRSGGADSSRTELIVKGSLFVEGTAASKVSFISASGSPAKGDWYGLRVLAEESNEQLNLAHLELRDSTRGIEMGAKSFGLTALLESCTISQTGGHGIYLKAENSSSSSLRINSSTLSSNEGSGIYLEGWSRAKLTVELSRNMIGNNKQYGLYLYSQDDLTSIDGTVSANEIFTNGDSGLYSYNNNSGKSSLSINDNTVRDNQGQGIHSNSSNATSRSSLYTIDGNRVFNNRDIGIYCYTYQTNSEVKLLGNTLYNNSQGIQVESYRSYTQKAVIRGNIVRDNRDNGLYIYSKSYSSYSPTIRTEITDNEIYRNKKHGVLLDKNSNWGKIYPLITLNRIYRNGLNGLSCRGDGPVNVLYNELSDNTGDGIYFEGGSGSLVNYNKLTGNRGSYELKNGTVNAIDSRYNFWSSKTLNEINAGANPKNIRAIYDSYDDSTKGIADYSSHLSTAPPLPLSMESIITSHADGLKLKSAALNIRGIAVAKAGLSKVELSVDNGATWHPVSGRESWSYDWAVPGDGLYTLLTRVTDLKGVTQLSTKRLNLTIDSSLPTTSGLLSGDESWSGEVLITGDLTVPSGVKLTIRAGTVVKFPALSDTEGGGADISRSELIVKGSLFVEGTAASKVRFISSATSPAKGDWYGLRVVTGESNEQLSLAHLEISDSSRGIEMGAKGFSLKTLIESCTVTTSGGHGLYFKAEPGPPSSLKVYNSTLSGNEGSGIYVDNWSKSKLTVEFRGNRLDSNGGYGLYLYNRELGTVLEGVVRGNELFANGSSGLYFYNNSNGSNSISINENIVYDNKNRGIDIYNDNYSSEIRAIVTANEIYNNGDHGLILQKYRANYGKLYPVITLNRIYKNGQNGIYCRGDGLVNVLYNTIRDNTGDGLYLEAGGGSRVNYNNLVGNKGSYALQNGSANRIDGRSNFWSPNLLAEMASGANPKNITGIFDSYDHASRGRVDYSAQLTSAVLLPTTMESLITSPADGTRLKASSLIIRGLAVAKGGVSKVELSADNGLTWHQVSGRESWSYEWAVPGDGLYTFLTRVTTFEGNTIISPKKLNLTIDSTLPTTSGLLSGDEVWSGEVLITGDLTVPSGVKLTIRAGTVVKFAPLRDDRESGADSSRTELIVKGSLFVEGTAASKVRLISASATPAKGDWYGLRVVTGESNEQLNLAHLELKDSLLGVEMGAKGFSLEAIFESCLISGTAGDALYLNSTEGSISTLRVVNSTLSNNEKSGIYLDNSSRSELTIELEGNRVDSNKLYGIYLRSKDDLTLTKGVIRANEISANSNNGLYSYSYNRAGSRLSLLNNIVGDNKGHGIYLNSSSSFTRSSLYTIDGNTIFNNSRNGIYAYHYSTGGEVKLLDNTIYANSYGVQVDSYYNNPLRAVIRGNTVRNNRNSGIHIYARSYSPLIHADIAANEIHDNMEHGLLFNRNSGQIIPTISLNNIYKNRQNGIHSRGNGLTTVLYNTISDNTGEALYLEGAEGSTVNYNNLVDNRGSYTLRNGTAKDIDGRYNFWSRSILDEMAAGSANISAIYDFFDRSSLGTVDYSYQADHAIGQPTELVSNIISPANKTLLKASFLQIKGIAVARKGINRVEISPDNGINWYPATGKESWSYNWQVPGDGVYTLMSRVIDSADNIESQYNRISLTIDSKQPTTSGTLTADEVWSGELFITGDVTVPENVKLTIEPGTVIRFAALQDDRAGGVNSSRTELIVKGELSAVGTSLSPIRFISSSANPARGDWYGIRVLTESKEASIKLENFKISHCQSAFEMMVKGQKGALTMISGEINETLGDAIHLEGLAKADSTINLSGNRITDSGGYGIYSLTKNSGSSLKGVIKANTINRTDKNGIYLHNDDRSSSSMEVLENSITKSGTYGIYAYSSNYSTGDVRIIGNSVSITKDGIYLNNHYSTVYGEISDNEISNNLGNGISLFSNRSSTLYSRILRNRIYKNSGDGIRINRVDNESSRIYPLIAFNTIYDNKSSGIYSFASGRVRINYNNIYGNSGYALHNNSPSIIDAKENWWGELHNKEMNGGSGFDNISALYDHLDESSKGKVDYRQWLAGAADNSADLLSRILSPAADSNLPEGSLTVEGIAFAGEQIGEVELSYDGGLTWHQVTGASGFRGQALWSYRIEELLKGKYTLQTRVVDKKGTLQSPVTERVINVGKEALTLAGVIERDRTWSGLVRLSGDLTVPAGVTLTIMPGTVIEAPALSDSTYSGLNQAKTELIINGTLLAAGRESEPITFTSYSSLPQSKGDWFGIRGEGRIDLEHALIEYGESGLNISSGGLLQVRGSTISNCSGSGIYYELGDERTTDIVIERSSLLNNGSNGFHLYSSDNSLASLTLEGNIFSGNGDNGIYCQADGKYGNPLIKANIIANKIDKSKNRGIYIETVQGGKSELLISNNEIHHSGIGIYSRYYSGGLSTISIEKNRVYSGTKGIEVYADYSSINPIIRNNTLFSNSQDAIRTLYNRANGHIFLPELEGNHSYDNSGNGIYLKATAAVTVTNNSIYGNAGQDLYNDGSAAVNAQSNWWGVTTTNELAKAVAGSNISAIYDKVDNSTKGLVDYSLWKELFLIPAIPVLETTSSPTKVERQLLKGSKEAGSGIVINGELAVPVDNLTVWSYDYPLKDGENRLKIYAENSAAMTSETLESLIILDRTAPALFSSQPAADSVVKQKVERIVVNLLEESSEIDGAATIENARVTDSQGNPVAGRWSSLFYQFSFTPAAPLGEGSYKVSMSPADSPLANRGAFTIEFAVDLQAPAAPLIEPVKSPANLSSQIIKGTKEAGSALWINGQEVVPGSAATTWHHELTLAEGENLYTLYLKDRAGNRSPESSLSITLDSKAPQLTQSVPAHGGYVSGSITELRVDYLEETTAIDSSKSLPGLLVKNSKGQKVAGQWSLLNGSSLLFKATQPLWEESYTLALKVFDLAGNSSSDTLSFSIDSTIPDAPTLNQVESPTRFSLQTLKGTKEPGSSIWLNGREVIPVNIESSWSYQLRLKEGINPLEIHSRDRAGNRTISLRSSIIYDDVAPLPVTTLKAEGRGSGTAVNLDWRGYDESIEGDVQSYNIYRSTALFTQLAALTPISSLPAGSFSYRVEGLVRGTKQYFAVVAVDSKGNYLKSVTPVSAVTSDVEAPEDVRNLGVVSYENRLIFNWEHSADRAADLSGYKLYLKDSSTPILVAKGLNSYEESGLSPATSYPVRITAYDGHGNESGGVSTTAVTLMDNPTGLVSAPQDGYIELSWQRAAKSELVKHYNIYFSEGQFHSVASMAPAASVKGERFKLSGLKNGVTYFMAVTTVNLSGGEKKDVVTLSDAPLSDMVGPQIVNLNWNESPLNSSLTVTKPGVIRVNAVDPMGVGRIEFRVDGKFKAMDSRGSDGYTYSWNIYETSDGPHEITVVAYDSIGNSSSWKGSLNVRLAAPAGPLIESPAANYITNRETIELRGTADPHSKIHLYKGGADTGLTALTDSKGRFQAQIILTEGANNITAVASNRAGSSAESAVVTVTLDTTLPDPPTGISAEAGQNGTVKLGWTNGRVPNLKGFNIYRARVPFNEINQALKVNKDPVPGNIYKDIPAEDGLYYYRFSTIDSAGNESLLSRECSVESDSTLPEAVAISYSPAGPFDAGGNRYAPGEVAVKLKVSERLSSTPYLALMAGDRTVLVELSQSAELEYSGSFIISKDLPSGRANLNFSARDPVGNRGTLIKEGGTIELDTTGPEVAKIELIPGYPIKSSQASPVEIRAIFSLSEELKGGTFPALSYLLSGTGRQSVTISNLRRVPAPGFAEGWEALFTLPADAAQNGVEMLSFNYSGEDDLANVGTKIEGLNSFEIYRDSLPALEAPLNLQAQPLAGGKIRLTWHQVEGAFDYQLLRKGPGEAAYSLYKRSAAMTEYIDSPAQEGSYSYLVTTVRSANGEESLSGHSNSATAISDKSAPAAPFNLKAELFGKGIMLEWQEGASTEPLSYRIYRLSGSELISTEGLTPLMEGIGQSLALDPAPSALESCYAVTAVDRAGNESAPSNSVYLNYKLLPVTNLKVRKVDDGAPSISWDHWGANIAGFDLYLDSAKGRIKLNRERVKGRTFSDGGHTIDERRYRINAVDNNGFEGPARELLLPAVRAELKGGQQIKRGLMNRLIYIVENSSNEALTRGRIQVELGGKMHSSDYFTLEARGTLEVAVRVGGYTALPDQAALTTTLEIIYPSSERVELVKTGRIDVTKGMLKLSLKNEQFVRGATGVVSFKLENSSTEEIEILTDEVSLQLLDSEGNLLSRAPYRESSGRALIRIAPNSSLSSEPLEIDIPSNVPDNLRIRLEVKNIHFHRGRRDHVVLEGLKSSREITLVETSYYGEISSVNPSDSYGKGPIIIKGRALQRGTKAPMGYVPLKLVVAVNGFERVFKIFTGADGGFSYDYRPVYGEAGIYSAAALHPDLKDRPEQAAFLIRAVEFSQAKINLNVPKNYQSKLTLKASPAGGTDLKNLRLLYRAEDQPGGVLPQGIHLELPEALGELKGGESAELNLTIWADSSAQTKGSIVLKAVSDEAGGAHSWHTLEIKTNFMEPLPQLKLSPAFIETGLSYESSLSEKVVLENSGLAALRDVRLRLLTEKGGAAPAWAYLTSTPGQGTLKVGEKREIGLNFSPDRTVPEGTYSFKLEVQSANGEVRSIPIFVNLITGDKGSIFFKLSNIYTDTKDGSGRIIEGLEGAKIKLQNEKFLNIEYNGLTNDKGELMLPDLPSGRYKYRVRAAKHEDRVGTLWVKAGITLTEEIFMNYRIVSVEWEVTESLVKDKYELLLSSSYETDVPAAVVVCEPASITIPPMEVGDVYCGVLKFTNYGLIKAEDVKYELPEDDLYYKYEMLGRVPSTIGSKKSVIVPFRITALSRLSSGSTGGSTGDNTGGSTGDNTGELGPCFGYFKSKPMWYIYKCSNGMVVEGIEARSSFTALVGDCSRIAAGGSWEELNIDLGSFGGSGGKSGASGGTSGSGSSGGSSGSGTGSGGSLNINYDIVKSSEAPAITPKYLPIEGVVCGPKIYCEVTDECCKAKARESVKSSIDLLTGEYSDEVLDLKLSISGKEIELIRYFYKNSWHFPESVQNIEPVYGVERTVPELINKGGVSYDRADEEGTVFSTGSHQFIFVEPEGYRWLDRISGEWKRYDSSGKLTAFGDSYNREVKLLYSDGRLSGMADSSGNRQLWYEYYSDGTVKSVRDAANRVVSYEYSAGKLTRVKDFMANFTHYSYDSEGRMSSRSDLRGETVKIDYNSSGYVKSFTYGDGSYKRFDYNFDSVKGIYYTQVLYSSGRVIERWYNDKGVRLRTDLNGNMQEKVIIEGRRRRVIDALGNETVKEYDEWNNLVKETFADGSSSSYRYDSQGYNLLEEIGADGVKRSYSYDSNNRVTKMVESGLNTAARTFEYSYDGRGNMLTSKNGAALTIMSYDSGDRLLTSRDGEGNLTTYSYDVDGYLERVTDGEGNSWLYSYDKVSGRLQQVTDPLKNTNIYSYDLPGNVKTFTDAAGRVNLFDYDGENRLTRQTNHSGRTIEFRYDIEGRLIERIFDGEQSEKIFYNADGRPLKELNIAGLETTTEYDNLGRPVKALNREGESLFIEYNRAGRVKRIRYPGLTQNLEYDLKGRLAGVVNDDGQRVRIESYQYNRSGKVTAVTDSAGRTAHYDYDAFGRMISRTDKEGGEYRYQYDNRNNLISFRDSKGNISNFEYDLNNRIVKKIYPDLTVREIIYDRNGRVSRVIDPEGQLTHYEYDGIGQLVKQSYYRKRSDTVAERVVSYGYDKMERMISWSDGRFSRSYQYDEQQMLFTTTLNYGTFSKSMVYGYDKLGRISSFKGPDSIEYSYHYDGEDRLSDIIIPGEGGISYESYINRQHKSLLLPGGIRQSYGYDPYRRLSSYEVNDIGGRALIKESYSRDVEGMLTSKSSLEGLYSYDYDGRGRLLKVGSPGEAPESYSYDRAGNRGGAGGSWSYNRLNQLLTTGDTTFTYDRNGNMESSLKGTEGYNYHYDIENRLTKIEDGSGKIVAQYSYGAMGRRLKKVVNGVTTYYLHSNEGLIAEYDESGRELKSYGYRPGSTYGSSPLFMKEGGKYYYYLTDYRGAPLKLVSKDGAIHWSARYDGAGRAAVSPDSLVENNLRGSSQYYDGESGFHYNSYRYYNPATGRYINRDPLEEAGGDNIYLFADNDPINNIDPLGLKMERVNCSSLSLNFSLGLTVGIGGSLGAGVNVTFCDCCDLESNRFMKGDSISVSASIFQEFNIGLAQKFGFGVVSGELGINIFSYSLGQSLSLTKECGEEGYSLTMTLLKIDGKTLTGSLAMGMMEATVMVPYSVRLSAEAYVTLSSRSLTAGFSYEAGYGLSWGYSISKKSKRAPGIDKKSGFSVEHPTAPGGYYGKLGGGLERTWSW